MHQGFEPLLSLREGLVMVGRILRRKPLEAGVVVVAVDDDPFTVSEGIVLDARASGEEHHLLVVSDEVHGTSVLADHESADRPCLDFVLESRVQAYVHHTCNCDAEGEANQDEEVPFESGVFRVHTRETSFDVLNIE